MRRPRLGFRTISVECGLEQGELGAVVRDTESRIRMAAERDERSKWMKRVLGCETVVFTVCFGNLSNDISLTEKTWHRI